MKKMDVDWKKITLYIKIGIVGAVLVLMGDFLMGWGVRQPRPSLLESQASLFCDISDIRMVASALLGMVGVPIACLGHFGIYTLLKPYSKKYSRLYAIGLLGFLSCGGAGIHLGSVGAGFFYKSIVVQESAFALVFAEKYALYFLLPLYLVMIISWGLMVYAQLAAVLKGFSPYPKHCWAISMAIGTTLGYVVGLFGNLALVNAIVLGAFSIGNVWSLVGHALFLDEAQQKYEQDCSGQFD